MCDCHRRSEEDEKIWRYVKAIPPTKEEWAFLHDAIERYITFRVQNVKAARSERADPPSEAPTP